MKRRKQIEQSVDAELFFKLREIAPPLLLSSYKIENTTLESAFDKFVVDRCNPVFEFSLPDEQVLSVCRGKLARLRDEIIHNQTDKSIESQYILKIDQYLSTIAILSASQQQAWEQFEKLNIERFGELDGRDARGLVSVRQKKHGIFGGITFDSMDVSYPLRVSNKLELLTRHFEATPFTTVDSTAIYGAREVASFWNAELANRYPGWTCFVSDTAVYVRTDNRKRRIIVPGSARFTDKKVIGLLAHEIGVHVRRREEGKRSRLQLLSIGMVGSEVVEEGLASMAEQAVGTKIRLGGTDRYIALALATGAVDGIKRDFRDTFALLEEYFFRRYQEQYDTERAVHLSQRGAWKLCVKIFRGGSPAIPGCCMRKEKIYREGSIAMWAILREQPDTFALWSKGKFDLRNPAQVELVKKYA
jgi:hypothetical protein